MFAVQSNGARLIYTISEKKPIDYDSCQLTNGYYFSKEPRSDEKLRYTETDITSIIRVVLFTYVFNVSPYESLLDLVNNYDNDYVTIDEPKIANELSLEIASTLLDKLFGHKFSTITKHSFVKIYNEYMTTWRYYLYGKTISIPSISDYLKLARFMNIPLSRYTNATTFINKNFNDHKIKLQGLVKML